MHAAGVNPVDTYIRSGTHSRQPKLPYTPGLDSAGIVTKIGKNVTKFKVSKKINKKHYLDRTNNYKLYSKRLVTEFTRPTQKAALMPSTQWLNQGLLSILRIICRSKKALQLEFPISLYNITFSKKIHYLSNNKINF